MVLYKNNNSTCYTFMYLYLLCQSLLWNICEHTLLFVENNHNFSEILHAVNSIIGCTMPKNPLKMRKIELMIDSFCGDIVTSPCDFRCDEMLSHPHRVSSYFLAWQWGAHFMSIWYFWWEMSLSLEETIFDAFPTSSHLRQPVSNPAP